MKRGIWLALEINEYMHSWIPERRTYWLHACLTRVLTSALCRNYNRYKQIVELLLELWIRDVLGSLGRNGNV